MNTTALLLLLLLLPQQSVILNYPYCVYEHQQFVITAEYDRMYSNSVVNITLVADFLNFLNTSGTVIVPSGSGKATASFLVEVKDVVETVTDMTIECYITETTDTESYRTNSTWSTKIYPSYKLEIVVYNDMGMRTEADVYIHCVEGMFDYTITHHTTNGWFYVYVPEGTYVIRVYKWGEVQAEKIVFINTDKTVSFIIPTLPTIIRIIIFVVIGLGLAGLVIFIVLRRRRLKKVSA